ncbi:hypothetical protein GA0070564_103105 [Micromonospora mirobrigensis]|uniref:Transposase DDE domain-containing protein n=1 Tax=Micromonospora mirobrigensis TaxID=262898 RepID=A0A1C4XHX5_9ACTN|nr:hypothetical protein GA0070564_103105 [Micromonospora mirobrigensis]
MLCDRRGVPLQVLISAANTPDAQLLFPLLDAMPRRLARRYERKAEHFQAFADFAAVLICHRRLAKITD